MLSRVVYGLLPYVYIIIGVLCALMIDSGLVYFSSALFIFTGIVVLWLRHAGGAMYRPVNSGRHAAADPAQEHHVKTERRGMNVRHEFPLVNHKGEIIAFDRRLGSY